jgi:hypothetical protein
MAGSGCHLRGGPLGVELLLQLNGSMGCGRGEGTAGAMGGCARRRGLWGGAGTAGAGRVLWARWWGWLGGVDGGGGGELRARGGECGRDGTVNAGGGIAGLRGGCARRRGLRGGCLRGGARWQNAMAERSVWTPTVLTYRVVEIP